MPYIESDSGIKWYFQSQGEGEVLLLIHGWAFDSTVWQNQIDYLSKTFRVVILNLPGHGLSEYREGVDIIQDLFSFVKNLNCENLTIMGHSFGGVLALRLALTFPQLINRLILVNTSPNFRNNNELQLGLDEADMIKMRQFLDKEYPNILLVFYRWLFSEQDRKSDSFKEIWRCVSKKDRWPQKEALASLLSLIEGENLTKLLNKIDVPTLISYGTKDPICSKNAADFMHREINNSIIKCFQGSGHLPFLIYADEFNKTIENFLINSNEYQITK